MVFTQHTREIVNAIEKQPALIKNESIIDAITGAHAVSRINQEYLAPILGMDGWVLGSPIGLFLTPSRIILYYEDIEKNHQFRVYPIERVENIELITVGWIRKDLQVKLYIDGTFVVVAVETNEAADEFIKRVKQCISSDQPINCDNIYCMKCGIKVPNDAIFCMKCGEKINI